MAKLLDVERKGHKIEKTWYHVGDNGQSQITTELISDAEPVFRRVKQEAQNPKFKDFRFIAAFDDVFLTDYAKQCGISWGVSIKDAWSELMSGKTDRAQKALAILKYGRDYRKFQAKHYQ